MSQHPRWHDEPIDSLADDEIGFEHLINRTARLVQETHSWDSSVVLALVGAWGSGKSSVLDLAIKQLDDEGGFKVVRFTPWATGDANGLLAEFYAAVATALPDEKFARFKGRLADIVAVASPAASLIPYAGPLVRGGADQFGEWLRRQKPWSDLFTKASAALRADGTPVLIVADDIDRLQGSELLEFLKVIRLLGRFPGLSYLLAYDETSLKDTIRSVHPIDRVDAANDFLEKFVQYPIYMPPLLPGQSLRLLNTALGEALEASGHELTEQDRRLNLIVDDLTALLSTPRAIKRFGAQLSLVLPLHGPGEINVVDMILLTLVRMQFPDAYAALPNNRSRLLSRETSYTSSTVSEFDWEPILGAAQEGLRTQTARTLLGTVFPATKSSGGSRVERPRAAHREYFDRYFLQAVPEDDVSDHVVHQALAAAASQDRAPLRELLTRDVGDRISTAISKLWSFSTDESADRPNVALLAAIMSLLPSLRGRTTGLFNERERTIHWARDILITFEASVSAAEVLAALREAGDLFLMLSVLWVSEEDERKLAGGVIEARDSVVDDVLDGFIEHLRMRDDAPVDSRTVSYASFLADYGAECASKRLASEINSGFTAEDYAARFVGLAYPISENPVPRINDFNLHPFQVLTRFDDDFFKATEIQQLDDADVTWANRRAYARGRAKLEESRDEGGT